MNWRRIKQSFRRFAGFLLALLLMVVAAFAGLTLTGSSREFHKVVIDGYEHPVHGLVSLGDSPSGNWVVFVHGNRKDASAHPLYQSILQNLNAGLSVIAIDMTGYGMASREGSVESRRSLHRRNDIMSAVRWLKREYGVDENNVVVVGHSLGALQALSAARDADFAGLALIGLGSIEHALVTQDDRVKYIEKFKRNTGIHLDDSALMEEVKQLALPVLFTPCPAKHVTIIQGAREPALPIAVRAGISQACSDRLTWQSIPLSDHMYGSESRLFSPFRQIYARFSQAFLVWKLNAAISATKGH